VYATAYQIEFNDDVDDAADNYNKVENIPRIYEIILHTKKHQQTLVLFHQVR